MSPVGFHPGAEKSLWWKVAFQLDEAQIALANASAHNVGDPRLLNALYDKLREGQGILLEILEAKGFMPNGTSGRNGAASPEMSGPAVPEQMITDAEIIDDPPPPTADGYTEGYAVQPTSEPEPVAVGHVAQATVEPAAAAAGVLAGADDQRVQTGEPAEPAQAAAELPPVPADVSQAPEAAAAEAERAE